MYIDLFIFLIHIVLLIWDLFCAGFLRVGTDGLLRDGLWNQSAQVQTHSGTHLVFLSAGLTLLTHQRRALRSAPSAQILHVRVRVQRTLLRTRGTHGMTWRTRGTNIHLIKGRTAPFIKKIIIITLRIFQQILWSELRYDEHLNSLLLNY